MSHISTRASGGVPPINFVQFSIPHAWYFTPDAQSEMQNNNNFPYSPNSMASDDTYLYTSPNPEEQSPQSYADLHPYHASQFPSSYIQPNDGRYYASSHPEQVHNQGLQWGSGMQQPFGAQGADVPHHTHDIYQTPSAYSAYPYATQSHQAGFPYPVGGDSSHFNSGRPVDPNTGMIFYPSTDSPRLRTAQACQKCRARKAKCSGDHPSCERCLTRGLVCEYAPEGRMRGPNKPKINVDSGPTPGPSRRTSHYSVDPVTGADTSGQGRLEYNQFPYGSADFIGGHSMAGHSLDASYAPSPVMHGSEGSRSGSSAGTPSSARSTPITSPGVNSPLSAGEMTQHQRNADSWLTPSAFDRHYDHPDRHTSP